ncbi:hypothetical protein BDF22DRAFT_662714 [Syncephalis plumigaleata]|nr:hypothetical protein BDF22DRAFT_704431 [Syncephalis plumigaleata]KAI8057887.1 hypothetical protein BDF22DRAFT_662714 [Syncephalis plumigaleata]
MLICCNCRILVTITFYLPSTNASPFVRGLLSSRCYTACPTSEQQMHTILYTFFNHPPNLCYEYKLANPTKRR